MNMAAGFLLGTHDFSFFRSSGSVQSSPVKTIYKAVWQEKAPGDLLFVIEGDGFLYRMVRNIVWNLAEAGLGRKSLEQFKEELDKAERHFKISRRRRRAFIFIMWLYGIFALKTANFA